MLRGGDVIHQTAATAQHIDCRKVITLRQLGTQHDMPIKDRAGFLGHRVRRRVAFGQYRVQRRDTARRAGTGAFQQTWQCREKRRRISASGRRLAHRQTDLALGTGETGQAVHQQQHIAALVAVVFGQSRGHIGCPDPLGSGTVRGGNHRDSACARRGVQLAFQQFAHLTAPLADQPDDDHVSVTVAHYARQQRRLAHAGLAKNAHPLPLGEGQQAIDSPHAQRQWLDDALATERRWRLGVQRVTL
ncbi:hypothetical protein ALP75_200174 [Pseudomonas syringae pv. actinidiae]|nr:hypothetical protein ALP75_200174 [Pseudomonas syringae pv. actinidiae]